MAESVEVWGPNLFGQSEQIHVHKVGCADTRKPHYRGAHRWTIDVSSMESLVWDVYDNIITEGTGDWRDYTDDIKVFPCVGSIPYEEET